jgi:putative DNA-invertase from lambdoid prophage Rac
LRFLSPPLNTLTKLDFSGHINAHWQPLERTESALPTPGSVLTNSNRLGRFKMAKAPLSRAPVRAPPSPPKIYVYARVSTGRQAEGDSLDAQRRVAEGYAIMKSKAIDETFSEEGVSGSIALGDRPRGRELLATVKRGDWIISPRLDRCFRSAIDALQVVEQLHERGVSLHLLDLGGDVSGNGVAKMFMTLAAAFAEFERHRIRERIQGSKDDCKARGRYLGGRRPFGWQIGEPVEGRHDRALVPDEAEQLAIVRIVALRKRGKTLRQISASITKAGVKISHEAVASVLRAQVNGVAHG